MIIRPIDSSEANAVSELPLTAYVSGGHLSADSPYILELRDVASRLNYTWVAEVGGNIVGTISLCPPDGASPAVLSRENEYEAQAISHGSEKMVISVVDLNERALKFYALQGYTRMPERDWSPVRTPDPQAVNCANTTPIQILALTKNL